MVAFMYVSYNSFVTPKARFVQQQVCIFDCALMSSLAVGSPGGKAVSCLISHACTPLHASSCSSAVLMLGQYFSTSLQIPLSVEYN